MTGACTTEITGAAAWSSLPDGDAVIVPSEEWVYQFRATQVVTQSGKIYGSGLNTMGKLGAGQAGSGCAIASFLLPSDVTAADLSTRDEYTTYVLGSDGVVYAAGRGDMGQLGNGTTTSSAWPVPVKIPRASTTY